MEIKWIEENGIWKSEDGTFVIRLADRRLEFELKYELVEDGLVYAHTETVQDAKNLAVEYHNQYTEAEMQHLDHAIGHLKNLESYDDEFMNDMLETVAFLKKLHKHYESKLIKESE